MLGLNLARNAQRFAHKVYRGTAGTSTPVDPKGWGNQISDGGELTALYAAGYERVLLEKLVTKGAPQEGAYAQLTAGAQATVGYNTELGGATSVRLGRIRSDFWEWRSNPLGNVNKTLSAGGRRPFELFVFGAMRPRLVGYNALLQGQFSDRSNPTRFNASEISRVVTEFDVGASLAFDASCRRVSLTYVAAGRTQEFKGPQARTHSWGSLFLTF